MCITVFVPYSGTAPLACLVTMLHSQVRGDRVKNSIFFKLPGRMSLFTLKVAMMHGLTLIHFSGVLYRRTQFCHSGSVYTGLTLHSPTDVHGDPVDANMNSSVFPEKRPPVDEEPSGRGGFGPEHGTSSFIDDFIRSSRGGRAGEW